MRCLLLFLLLPLLGRSQDSLAYGVLPYRGSKITYEKVIEVPGISKEELYTRAKSWAVSGFKSQKDALQADDKEAGVLIYKTFFPLSFVTPKAYGFTFSSTKQYWHLIKILLKDEKAKVFITEIQIKDKFNDASMASTTAGIDPQPIETVIEYYRNPEPELSKYLKKKQVESQVEYIKKTEAKFIENVKLADVEFKNTIQSIESHLTGKKKSDFDF